MMPGIGFEEMILLVLVAIVVIGPKDLPLMMRKFGRFTGKMRAMAFEFKQGFEELGRQAELEELRREVAELKNSTGLADLRRELEEDTRALEADVKSALESDAKPRPAAEPRPYAGLSADHPGYDAGEDFRIDGAPPPPPPPPPPPAETSPAPAKAEGESDVHVIPDDHVRPAHPALKVAPAKQDTPA